MADSQLERAGIILSMFAGVIFGLDFFIRTESIVWVNNLISTYPNQLQIFLSPYIFPISLGVWLLFMIPLLYLTRSNPVESSEDLEVLGEEKEEPDGIIMRIVMYSLFLAGFITAIFALGSTFLYFASILGPISPKGAIGTIAIILFLLGNALQLWATFE
jgi:hypothetical protein